MLPILTHLALHVHELEETVRFYKNYCDLNIVHDRESSSGSRVVWMAREGFEKEFIFVFISGGPLPASVDNDYSHLGFALDSKNAVDQIAQRARDAGCLAWEPRQEPYPVGYYCALKDPQGNFVEFSYGQPLGPGAEDIAAEHEEG